MDSIEAFKLLELNPNASYEEIKQAYHNLVWIHHPDHRKNGSTNEHFIQITKAFELLKSIKEYLKETTETTQQQLPPNEYKLKLTLEEIYHGCIKTQTITRKITDEKGIKSIEKKELSVRVPAGSLPESRITIEKEGDREHGKLQANVIFIVTCEPHPIFKRQRFDISCNVQVYADDVEQGQCEVGIPTIDNEKLTLTIEDYEDFEQNKVQRIAQRGLPIPGSAGKRGDLIVTLELIYDNNNSESESD